MKNIGLRDMIAQCLVDILSIHDEHKKITIDDIKNTTQLIGPHSVIDSLTLVSFIVDIEQKVNDKYDISITIVDERAMSQQTSPFKTIGTLAEYVQFLIKDQKKDA